MSATLPFPFVVTDAEMLSVTVDALNPSTVVTFSDPDSEIPACNVDHRVVIRCLDAEISTDEWKVRFRGDPAELFQRSDVAPLLAALDTVGEAGMVVHCGQGVSRSTAAAVLLGAAAGLSPDDAVAESIAAQNRSFQWRPRAAWIPNMRIIDIGSQVIFGDDRLRDAVEAGRPTPLGSRLPRFVE